MQQSYWETVDMIHDLMWTHENQSAHIMFTLIVSAQTTTLLVVLSFMYKHVETNIFTCTWSLLYNILFLHTVVLLLFLIYSLFPNNYIMYLLCCGVWVNVCSWSDIEPVDVDRELNISPCLHKLSRSTSLCLWWTRRADSLWVSETLSGVCWTISSSWSDCHGADFLFWSKDLTWSSSTVSLLLTDSVQRFLSQLHTNRQKMFLYL